MSNIKTKRKSFGQYKKTRKCIDWFDARWFYIGGKCESCGKEMVRMDRLPKVVSSNTYSQLATIDHLVPLVLGGENSTLNFRIICLPCNARKGVKWKL